MFKDLNGPVDYEGPMFENANMSVLHCREVMERTGMTDEARRLTGLEVTGRGMAEVALEVLNQMKVRAEAEYARQIALSSVQAALSS